MPEMKIYTVNLGQIQKMKGLADANPGHFG